MVVAYRWTWPSFTACLLLPLKTKWSRRIRFAWKAGPVTIPKQVRSHSTQTLWASSESFAGADNLAFLLLRWTGFYAGRMRSS